MTYDDDENAIIAYVGIFYGLIHAYHAKFPDKDIPRLVMQIGYDTQMYGIAISTTINDKETDAHDFIGFFEKAAIHLSAKLGQLPEYNTARLRAMGWGDN